MKKSSKIPDSRLLIFAVNHARPGIFDLQNEPSFTKFTYFRLERPKAEFLIHQGARYVLESWKDGKKNLFTGLIPSQVPGWYYGDHLGISLLICHLEPEGMELKYIEMYYFNAFNKHSARIKNSFCLKFIKELKRAGKPRPALKSSNNQNRQETVNSLPSKIAKND